tara:strand:+ start:1026 stop:1796 length:771 start_codon:yes stop_codon:yes gene_type:complete
MFVILLIVCFYIVYKIYNVYYNVIVKQRQSPRQKNSIALVNGIGKSDPFTTKLAAELLTRGWDLVLCGIDEAQLKKVEKCLNAVKESRIITCVQGGVEAAMTEIRLRELSIGVFVNTNTAHVRKEGNVSAYDRWQTHVNDIIQNTTQVRTLYKTCYILQNLIPSAHTTRESRMYKAAVQEYESSRSTILFRDNCNIQHETDELARIAVNHMFFGTALVYAPSEWKMMFFIIYDVLSSWLSAKKLIFLPWSMIKKDE